MLISLHKLSGHFALAKLYTNSAIIPLAEKKASPFKQ